MYNESAEYKDLSNYYGFKTFLLVLFRDCWNVCRISSFHTMKCKEGPNCRFSIQLGFRELEVLNLSQTLHLFYIQVTIIEFLKDIINLPSRGIFWGNFTPICDFSELVCKQRAALKSLEPLT